jgi:hypothetical protein
VTQPDHVPLLEVEPRLGAGLSGRELADARRLAVAPLVTLPAGRWEPDELRKALGAGTTYGCLVHDGLVAHELALGERAATHLLGRGDILAPAVRPGRLLPLVRFFGVADATRLVVLDETFPGLARQWPSIAVALLVQAERQLERVAVQQLISQMPRAEARIVALFWHLADRWGRAEAGGVVVPVTLSHEALSRLVDGQRPTISAALGRLAELELLVRRPNGTWFLAMQSRALLDGAPTPGPVANVRLLGTARPPPRERGTLRVT